MLRLPQYQKLLLACAVAALGAACSDPPASGPGRLDRPALTQVGERPTAESHLALPVPEGLSGWTIEGPGQAEAKKFEGERVLRLTGRGERRLVIPGSYEPRAFNQLLLTGIFPGPVGIQVRLEGGEQEPYESQERVTSANKAREQLMLFDLDRLFLRKSAFERLVIVIKGGPVNAMQLHDLELVHRPSSAALPGPEQPHELIDVGGEARTGFAIGDDFGARTSFRVEDAQDSLRFAHAVPPTLGRGLKNLELSYTLSADGEEVAKDSVDVSSKKWRDVEVALGAWVGKELQLELSASNSSKLETVVALAGLQVTRAAEAPRTVLLVTSDTHRGDHVGFARSDVQLDTPVLDALARRGVVFDNAHSVTNVTSPSHVSVMTGVHPRDHRVVSNTSHMTPAATTLAEVYQQAGWATGGVVSVRHLGPYGTGLGQGFDRMFSPPGEPWDAEDAVDRLLGIIEDAEGQPLFLWLHVFDAHFPYGPPGKWDRRYYPDDRDPFDASLGKVEAEPGNIPKPLEGLADLEFPLSQYRAEVDYIDHQLGRVLAVPRVGEGLIAVTSDHGEILEKDGTYFNHSEIFPDTLHVPLVLAFEDSPVARIEHPVQNLDVGRTLLDLSGLASADFPGRSLMNTLEGPPVDGARFALSAHGNSASITEGDWFFLLHLRTHKGPLRVSREKCSSELYNLRDDPDCLVDRKQADPGKAAELCRRLSAWLRETGGPALTAEGGGRSAEEVAQLQALGYATDSDGPDEETPWLDPDCEPCKDL